MTTGSGKTGAILLKDGVLYKKFSLFFKQAPIKKGLGVFDKEGFIP
jgi:hypothetical protein